jgi:hypothetical protein
VGWGPVRRTLQCGLEGRHGVHRVRAHLVRVRVRVGVRVRVRARARARARG